MQIERDNPLVHYRLKALNPIDKFKKDIALREQIYDILRHPEFLCQEAVIDRQLLLKAYLNRALSEKKHNKNLIDILGKKLVHVLKSDLIQYPDLWSIIQECIREYCFRTSYRMSREEHILFNGNIFEINNAYTNALQYNSLMGSEFFDTRRALDMTINTIWSYYHMSHVTNHVSQETQTDTSVSVELLPTSPISPTVSSTESSPRKMHLTKKQRAEQKKLRQFASIQDSVQDDIELNQPAEPNLVEVPKTKEMLKLEYLKQEQNNIRNHERFFSYAKECYESETTTKETSRILQEISDNADQITLLYLAKFQISCQKSLDLFISLFDQAITENNIYQLIEKIVETNLYADLVKWANDSTQEEIALYESHLISYIESSIPITVDLKKRWLSCNVKLFQAILQKTADKKTIATILINMCTIFGYSELFDNFIIKPEELIKYIKDHIDSLEEYHTIIERILDKEKKAAEKLALELCIICSETFNDPYTTRTIYRLIKAEDPEKSIYWLRKLLTMDPQDESAKYILAAELASNRKLYPNTDYEIIDLLKNNSLYDARHLYCCLYVDDKLHDKIDLSPDELMDILDITIASPQKKDVNFLIEALILMMHIDLAKNDEQVNLAVKRYTQESDITDQEKQELRKIIYTHSLFNKKIGWPQRFAQLCSFIAKARPDLSVVEFLKSVEHEYAEQTADYIESIRTYDFELKDGQTDIDQNFLGKKVLQHMMKHCNFDLVRFIAQNHPAVLKIKSPKGDSVALSYVISCLNIQIYPTILPDQDTSKSLDIDMNLIRVFYEVDPTVITEPNNDGVSLLHIAARFNLPELFAYLVEKCNMKIEDKDSREYNAVSFAIQHDNIEILEYIHKNYPDLLSLIDILKISIMNNRIKTFNYFFSQLSSEKDKDISFLLDSIMYAAQKGYIDIVKSIINSDQNFIEKILKTHPEQKTIDVIQLVIELCKERRKHESGEKLKSIKQVIKYLEEYHATLEAQLKAAAISDKKRTKSTRKKK